MQLDVGWCDGTNSHLIVESGLNLIGRCSNSKCKNKDKRVIMIIGLGNFNIAKEQCNSKCPTCKELIEEANVQNLGFYDCTYSIEGQYVDGSKINVEKKCTEERKFDTFKEEPENEGKWRYLEITCESRNI